MKGRLTKYERETIITFNEAEQTASIYTYNTALKNRLVKFSKQYPSLAKLTATHTCRGVTYEIDKSRLSIRLTAPYSDERRAKARNYAQEHNIVSNLNRSK